MRRVPVMPYVLAMMVVSGCGKPDWGNEKIPKHSHAVLDSLDNDDSAFVYVKFEGETDSTMGWPLQTKVPIGTAVDVIGDGQWGEGKKNWIRDVTVLIREGEFAGKAGDVSVFHLKPR